MARNEAKRERRPSKSQMSPKAMIPVLANFVQKVDQTHRKTGWYVVEPGDWYGKAGTPLKGYATGGSNEPEKT
eukprot:8803410-Heterocapsa_arctica.AAC.1